MSDKTLKRIILLCFGLIFAGAIHFSQTLFYQYMPLSFFLDIEYLDRGDVYEGQMIQETRIKRNVRFPIPVELFSELYLIKVDDDVERQIFTRQGSFVYEISENEIVFDTILPENLLPGSYCWKELGVLRLPHRVRREYNYDDHLLDGQCFQVLPRELLLEDVSNVIKKVDEFIDENL